MFQPFVTASQFYAGLIVWCDSNCYEQDITTLAPDEPYDRKKARELRPCLVVDVNYPTQSFQVARICATKPTDTRKWVRVDSLPALTWRIPDAWIWVGTPPTVTMVFNNPKVMHPHKDTTYTMGPIASANLQNYWIHRQNYINARQMGGGATATTQQGRGLSTGMTSHGNPYYTPQSSSGQVGNFNQMAIQRENVYPDARYLSGQVPTQTAGFISDQPVVVPAGFTETHPSSPGWWRNPETGWFWHASRGLMPPSSSR
ncbi:hypothetical protein DFH07DRAFT_766958 [Mycena maculata]|uniref:Uncharacterized protein n=1 Tax=Mycena maculata TaxID=230809 RepID=A0AAD7K582_9AGAR|nr:hypothetical protein DFH07DRAFT_766958 [Mycena maculata]